MIGFKWAKEPLSRIATGNLSFQQLYSELEISVQLERESSIAAASSQASEVIPSTNRTANQILFNGQGRFIRANHKPKSFATNRKRSCFNCGSESHLVGDCPQPVNFSRAAANRIRQLRNKSTQNAIHVLLAHLCSELDDATNDECNGDDEDDAAVFAAMLVNENSTQYPEQPNPSRDTDIENLDIYAVSDEWTPYSTSFLGACIDSGAQKTVIGINQANAYLNQTSNTKNLLQQNHKGQKIFRFGNRDHKCIGMLNIRMPVGEDIVVTFQSHVVSIDVPLLLGLDVLQKLKLLINFEDGTLHSPRDHWRVQLVQKFGHLYVEWPMEIYYTEQELRRIHRHFYHPSTSKLQALIQKGAPKHNLPDLAKTLDHVRDTCDTCQRLAKEPSRFRVSMPSEDCVFNRTVGMDLMKINKKTVLHVVDKDTKFSAATFTKGESSENIWEAFLCSWVAPYIGYPDIVILDQGPQFQSTEFSGLLTAAGIQKKSAGVESHNALGEVERYHAYLRNVFERVQSEHTGVAEETLLALTVKACNDTAGPSGMDPALLVFGVIPRMPIHPEELPKQRERMNALHIARQHMNHLTAKNRLSTAVNRQGTNATDRDILIGDAVLVYRDTHGRWSGPFRVIKSNDKVIIVDQEGRLVQYSVDRVKHYTMQEDAQNIIYDHSNEAENTLREPSSNLETNVNDSNDIWNIPDPLEVFVIKIIQSNDPRAALEDFQQAKKVEVDGLVTRKIWHKVPLKSVPSDANIVSGRFLLTLKNVDTPDETPKVRYVAQGYSDVHKQFIAHDLTTLRPTSIRLILAIAATKNLRLFTHDVTQAYLQSKEMLTRDVYLRPKVSDRHLFDVKDDELLKLNKPLYGLCDSGDYWNATIEQHLTKDMHMVKAISDPSLYFRFHDNILIGLTGNYVDDNLNAGNVAFQKESELTLNMFESKPRTYDNFSFFGTQIMSSLNGPTLLSQHHYCDALKILDKKISFHDFQRARSILAWTTHSHPEVTCVCNKAAQVTEKSF